MVTHRAVAGGFVVSAAVNRNPWQEGVQLFLGWSHGQEGRALASLLTTAVRSGPCLHHLKTAALEHKCPASPSP